MVFETIKDIKKGEELTIDYYDGSEEEIFAEFTDFHKKAGDLGL